MGVLFAVFTMLCSTSLLYGSDKVVKADWLQTGTELVYNVMAFGDGYEFVLNLSEVGEQIAFDYYMTSNNRVEGSVIIPASSMADASSHMNYFSGGEAVLNGQTTVFFSRGAFADILSGQTVTIDAGMGKIVIVRKQTAEEMEAMHGDLLELESLGEGYMPYGGIYMLNGKDDSHKFFDDHIVLVDENGKHIYSVLNDPDFPLITFMDLGWSIELIYVNSPR